MAILESLMEAKNNTVYTVNNLRAALRKTDSVMNIVLLDL